MSITGNKGEWSELYALLHLLAEGKLYAANEDAKKLDHIFFPILKILREEHKPNLYEYRIASDTTVEIYLNNVKRKAISRKELGRYATHLYNNIIHGENRAFPIENADKIMEELECTKIAAPSTDKTDITMQLHDIQTGYNPICGFSIKSELGNPPTLLNASGSTNFVYEVKGLTEQQMEEINSINTGAKISDRIKKIREYGSLEFVKCANPTFACNLMMVDSRMEEIVADMLLYQYSNNIKSCVDVVAAMEKSNPLHFPKKGFYEYKFKKLLCAIALGMMPATPWDGHDEANGGYVIVTVNGDVLAYHIYNRDFFEAYLLKNTKFDRPSTTRHNYASIYQENEKMYINLNIQIRFK